MTSPLPQPPSSSSSPSTSSPSSSLSPLLPILNAFNHRHHNQHRLAHWWPVFRILRRTIRALIDDLALPSSTSFSSKPTSRPRRDAAASPSPPPRAIWLSKHFIPRAYIAFSQLAADNQHAPLGLLLLAVLSRVHAVVTQLLDRANTTSSTSSTTTKQPSLSRHRPVDASNQDKGVAVSRDVLPPRTQPTEPLQSLPPTTTTTITSGRPSLDDPRGEDANPESMTATQLSKTKQKEAPSKEDKKKKKKKKKGKGDELSSLFGSLA